MKKKKLFKRNNVRHFTANAVLRPEKSGGCRHKKFSHVYSRDFVAKICADCGKELENIVTNFLNFPKLLADFLKADY